MSTIDISQLFTTVQFYLKAPCNHQHLCNMWGWMRVWPWLDRREMTAFCWEAFMAPPFFFSMPVLSQRWHRGFQEYVWNGWNPLPRPAVRHVHLNTLKLSPFAPTSPSFLTHFGMQTSGAGSYHHASQLCCNHRPTHFLWEANISHLQWWERYEKTLSQSINEHW